MTSGRAPGGRAERLTDVFIRLANRRASRDPRVERILVVLAAVIFVGASVVGFRQLPELEGGVRWVPLVVLASAAVPVTVLWNALEYVVTGRLLATRVPAAEALRVSVLSSAANLLPIPGALIVRSRALSQLGSTYGRAAASTAVVGLAWLATSFVAAGLFLALGSRAGVAIACLVVGVVGLVGTYALVARRVGRDRRPGVMAEIVAVEAGFVAILGLRMYLVLLALGFSGLDRGFSLALAAVVANASGFFPGGFGMREVLAGVVSPLVGLPAAVGVVVAAIDRLIGLAVLAVIAILFVVFTSPSTRDEAMERVGEDAPDTITRSEDHP